MDLSVLFNSPKKALTVLLIVVGLIAQTFGVPVVQTVSDLSLNKIITVVTTADPAAIAPAPAPVVKK